MSETMNENTADFQFEAEESLTANDRFKGSFSSWFWGSMIAATVLHFAIFALYPELEAENVGYSADVLTAIEIPPEVDIPPPPEAIQRPATPVIAEAAIDEEIVIAKTTFESNPVDQLPPPPSEVETDISQAYTYTPFSVAPRRLNDDEVQRALQREYPPLLRDAGIGGTVEVDFFISEEGRVVNALVRSSSGHVALDDAALRVADVFRFSPAMNRENVTAVWVTLPITFTTR